RRPGDLPTARSRGGREEAAAGRIAWEPPGRAKKRTVPFFALSLDREREALAHGLRRLRPALEHHLVAPRQPRFVEHAVRPHEDHLDDHVDPAGDIGHAVEFPGTLVDAKPGRAFNYGEARGL